MSGILYHHDAFYVSPLGIVYNPAMYIVRYDNGALRSKIHIGYSSGDNAIYDSETELDLGTSDHPISHLYVGSISPENIIYTAIGASNNYFGYGYIKNIYYNTLVQNSSKDIKHNITPLPSVGDKLDRLEPVTFVYDDDKDEKVRAGLIYEDTVEVLPEICTDDESNKAINYVELIPMLLKEIQELRARVKALEEREEE